MKKLILLSSFLVLSCAPQNKITDNTSQNKNGLSQKITASDAEITVLDVDFDKFLETKATPISSYSVQDLKKLNDILVLTWNQRYDRGLNPRVYTNDIDYDVKKAYKKEFEYKLYQFFAFNAYKYKVSFPGLDSNRESGFSY